MYSQYQENSRTRRRSPVRAYGSGEADALLADIYSQHEYENDSLPECNSDELEYETGRSSRSYIRWVQRSLNRIMNSNLAVDGIVGARTSFAIRLFQQRAGIGVDGIVGPNTERALIAAGASRPPTSEAKPYHTVTGIGGADGQLTRDFHVDRFACRGIPVPNRYLDNVRELAQNLQVLHDYVERPIRITSGYRTPAHNARIGGASNSQHLYARAADLQIPGLSLGQVYCTIEKLIKNNHMKEGGLGIYTGHIHYDVRGRRARWTGGGASFPDCTT